MTERRMGTDGSDNNDCPRFIAYVSDSFVEADDSLDVLIEMVKKDGLGTGEDAVIWDSFHTVAAVIRADGSVHRFKPTEPTRNGTTKEPVMKRFHPAQRRK